MLKNGIVKKYGIATHIQIVYSSIYNTHKKQQHWIVEKKTI
jgi:hypothetical protein